MCDISLQYILLFYHRWSANSAEQNSYTGDTPPQDAFVKFPLKDYVWYHLVLSVRAGRDDDVGAGRVSDVFSSEDLHILFV